MVINHWGRALQERIQEGNMMLVIEKKKADALALCDDADNEIEKENYDRAEWQLENAQRIMSKIMDAEGAQYIMWRIRGSLTTVKEVKEHLARERAAELVGEGEALLKLGKIAEAEAAFREVLALSMTVF